MSGEPVASAISEEEWERLWGGRKQLWLTSEVAAVSAGIAFFLAGLVAAMARGDWESFGDQLLPVFLGAFLAWFIAIEVKWLNKRGPRWNAWLNARWPKAFPLIDPNKPKPLEVWLRNLLLKYPQITPGIVVIFMAGQEFSQSTEDPKTQRLEGIIGTIGVITMGVITWYWIRGMHRRPQKPALYGALAGAVSMIGLGLVMAVLFTMGQVEAGRIFSAVFTNAMYFAFIGLFGGLALQKLPPHLHVGTRAAIGTAVATIIFWFVARDAFEKGGLFQGLMAALALGVALILYKPAAATFAGEVVPAASPPPSAPAFEVSPLVPPPAPQFEVLPPVSPVVVPDEPSPPPEFDVSPPDAPAVVSEEAVPLPEFDVSRPVAPIVVPDEPGVIAELAPVSAPEEPKRIAPPTLVPIETPTLPAISARLVAGPVPGSLLYEWSGLPGTAFEVQWSSSSGFDQVMGFASCSGSNQFIVSGLQVGVTYWVRVRSAGTDGWFGACGLHA